jgi:hypothetical protein
LVEDLRVEAMTEEEREKKESNYITSWARSNAAVEWSVKCAVGGKRQKIILKSCERKDVDFGKTD